METRRFVKLQSGIVLLLLLLAVSTARGQNPAPFISQPLFPQALAPGGPSFILTVNGTGFVSSSVVNWNSSALATTFVNSEQLKAAVPSANIASQGTAWVTVSSGGVVSNVVYFDVTNATSSVSFDSTNFYALLGNPVSVAAGDFNGDGKLDLAVANVGGSVGAVSILLGNGEGTFQPAVNYDAGSTPDSVAIGDFNGDGKLDLVVANHLGATVSVLLGNGDGTFQSAVAYPTGGANPSSVVVGDFNGDGKLDLAVADIGLNVVSVLLGKGDGIFQSAQSYTAGTSGAYSLHGHGVTGADPSGIDHCPAPGHSFVGYSQCDGVAVGCSRERKIRAGTSASLQRREARVHKNGDVLPDG
jgi:FG-GAP-like repeat/FG-GAP repeat/IPT/TIG domain